MARPRRISRGFTLMELMVAMSVTILLVALLMKVFSATSTTWQHGEAQVDAYREARGALQIIARDLSATLQTSYAPTNMSLSANKVGPLLPTLVLEHYPAAAGGTQGGPNNEEVYCLTNISSSGSSLCAVGYYCQWMPDLAATDAQKARAPRAYALMRQFLDSNGTFQRIKAKSAAASAGTPAPAPTPTPALVPLEFMDLYSRTGTTGVPGARSDQLAAYIWDLRFRIDTDLSENKVPDGNEPGKALDHSTPQQLPYAGKPTPRYPTRLPAYVEVRFKALSTTAGRRLENQKVNPADWLDSDPDKVTPLYKNIIRPNAQQFVLRVPLSYSSATTP